MLTAENTLDLTQDMYIFKLGVDRCYIVGMWNKPISMQNNKVYHTKYTLLASTCLFGNPHNLHLTQRGLATSTSI